MSIKKSILEIGTKFLNKNAVKKGLTRTSILTGATVAGHTALEAIFGEPTIHPKNRSEVIELQFPLDGVSSGGMFTEIRFHSWKKGDGVSATSMGFDGGNQQTSTHKTDFLGMVRLPMPLQLATGYQGNYTEGDSLSLDRRSTGLGAIDKAVSITRGIGLEVKNLANATANLSSTAEMGNATIDNNNMGMLYKGGGLRGHDFSWRLSAKNPEEQIAIQQIVRTLKWFSSPANPGHLGGASDTEVASLVEKLKDMEDNELQAVADEVRFLGGRLAIPPTCTVRFLVDDETNPHLFKVKDSFITNLTTNYTASSGWGAHEDGAPMEVQIGLTMKEIRTITRRDVEAGY
jgi:hypothetical protein